MEIKIAIERKGHAVGTIGWLAENAHHITVAACEGSGEAGAWLKDAKGNILTILALGGEFGAHNADGIDVVTRQVGAWPLAAHVHFTDAAWVVVQQLAEIARQHMTESEEMAAGYQVTVGVVR